MKPLSKTHPHTFGAITRLTNAEPSQATGGCFFRAAGFALDEPTAVLCVGIFRAATPEEIERIGPGAATIPFYHAWCEWQGKVVAPTTFEEFGYKLQPMNKAGYYALNGVRDIRRLPRPRLLQISKEIGLGRLLLGRQERTSEPWGSRLLTELGFTWQLTEDGGLVP